MISAAGAYGGGDDFVIIYLKKTSSALKKGLKQDSMKFTRAGTNKHIKGVSEVNALGRYVRYPHRSPFYRWAEKEGHDHDVQIPKKNFVEGVRREREFAHCKGRGISADGLHCLTLDIVLTFGPYIDSFSTPKIYFSSCNVGIKLFILHVQS